MTLIEQLVALGLFHWLMLMSPGPDFLMMLRIAISHSIWVAFSLAAGIATAIVWHTAIVVYAGQPLMEWLPLLQLWLPWVCGAYLIWLAITGWVGLKAPDLAVAPLVKISAYKAFYQGLLCNLLNPKAYLYFISLLTGVLSAQMPEWFKTALVIEFSLLAFLWFGLLAAMLRLPWLQQRLKNSAVTLERITLVLLGSFGIALLGSAAQQLI